MKKNGFTLIELLVSIGIIGILASVSFVNLYGYYQRKNFNLVGQEITAILRSAQDNSISQEQSAQWGVHFENTTSSDDSDFYVLFYGNSYAVSTSSQKSPLPSGINFTNPIPGTSFDVIFTPITGTTTSTVVSIVGTSAGTVKDIVIKSNGGVSDNLEEGLVGYWHFDEGTGHATTTDASGFGNTGTLINSPTWTSGASCKSGSCISFDGSNDYVIANQAITSGNSTWVVWVNIVNPSATSKNIFLSQAGRPYLTSDYSCSGRPAFNTATPTHDLCSPDSISSNTWYMLTGVADNTNTTKYVYVNGILKNSSNTAVGYPVGSTIIGAFSVSSYFTQGLIDEVRIYNRALSATEVLKLYNDFK